MATSSFVKIFSALANQHRLDILICLRNGPKNVTELMESTKASQSTISHSLFKLSASGLITSTPKDRFRYYSISSSIVSPLLDVIDGHTEK